MSNHLVEIWNSRVNQINFGFLIKILSSDWLDTIVIFAERIIGLEVVIFIGGISVSYWPLFIRIILAINGVFIFNPFVKSAVQYVNIFEPERLENPCKSWRAVDDIRIIADENVIFAHIELAANLLKCF